MNKNVLRLFFKPLTILNKFTAKDSRLIFFYSNLGFRDNVKAMYDYLIEEKFNMGYKFVVSINDYEDYKDNAPENVTFVNNKEGIKYFMKAKYAFYCFGKYPIKPSKKQTVVNLWHGMPLKKIGNMESGLEKIDYNIFYENLYQKDLPPVDLLIRTSGEERISNCMIYELAYAEFVFEPTYWPSYTPKILEKNLEEFLKRNRRYGGIKKWTNYLIVQKNQCFPE